LSDAFAPSEIFDLGLPLDEPVERDMEDAEATVLKMVEEAIHWREEHLDPALEKATKYYKSEPFGDEQEGRSKVVTSEVRDVVQAIMPSLMRVFFGSERVVEFKPRHPEDVPVAEQQTEYINYIIQEDNPGFLTFYGAFKDALVRKMGIVKYWWEDDTEVEGSEHTGLPIEAVEFLEMEDGTEVEILDVDEETGLVDLRVLRIHNNGRVRIAIVPPEEFIFSPSARGRDDALLMGHVREVTASELVAMGVPDDLIDDAKSQGGSRITDDLQAARRIDGGARSGFEDEGGEANRLVRFAEVYTRFDFDEDGIAELRKIQIVGKEFFSNEVVDDVPFAIFQPDPEPHTMVGDSLADYVMDLQRVKSAITRGMLDSLAQHLNPATEVVEGEVNMKDVLNPEVGRIIRARRPGMMREVATTFVGGSALPVLEYMDSVKEDRTGISKAASGLDADALQSSTKAAVAATISAAHQRTELIARLFAETGMRDLMRGLLRLVVQHQDQARMVRLRNEFVQVDPKSWDADMDVIVNVALGTGLVEEKLQMLAMIAEKQEQHIQMGSPLAGFAQLRHTYGRIVELAGFRNSDEFFKPFGPEEEQQLAQAQAQAEQKPDEIEALMQIEMAKIQARKEEKQMEMQLRVAQLELERERVARDLAIKEADVDRKSRADLTDEAIAAARLEIEAGTQAIDRLRVLSQTRVGE
jgi:hypothetical protein